MAARRGHGHVAGLDWWPCRRSWQSASYSTGATGPGGYRAGWPMRPPRGDGLRTGRRRRPRAAYAELSIVLSVGERQFVEHRRQLGQPALVPADRRRAYTEPARCVNVTGRCADLDARSAPSPRPRRSGRPGSPSSPRWPTARTWRPGDHPGRAAAPWLGQPTFGVRVTVQTDPPPARSARPADPPDGRSGCSRRAGRQPAVERGPVVRSEETVVRQLVLLPGSPDPGVDALRRVPS